MKKYNISTNFIEVIKNLCNKATSAVLFNSSIGDWFRTTVGVRQGCLLSSTLFDIFYLEDFFVRYGILPFDAKDWAKAALVKPLQ